MKRLQLKNPEITQKDATVLVIIKHERNSSGIVSALLTEPLAGASFMPPWIPSLPSANWRLVSPN